MACHQLDMLFVLGLLFRFTMCDLCVDNAILGGELNSGLSNPDPGYVTFMVENFKRDINITCCGIAKKVKFRTSAVGDVTFQIWRPAGGSVFILVDQVTVTATVVNTVENDIDVALSIQPEDRYGWYANPDIMMYKASGSSGNEKVDRFAAAYTTTVGDTLNFATGGPVFENDQLRSPALSLVLNPGNEPMLTSSAGTTVNLNTADPIGTYVTTLTAADNDPGDVLSITMTTITSNYTLTVYASRLANITTAASLKGFTRNETLVFNVTDPCGKHDNLTLTLIITNDPPIIHNLPASNMLHEDVTALTHLRTINVTDSVDSVTCSMVTTDPFQVSLVPATTDTYAVYSVANPSFSYMVTNFYKMTVQCTDGDPFNTVSKNYYVYLLNNHPPNITNLQDSVTISTSHMTSIPVYTVTAVDDEGDDMNFTLSCYKAISCPFQILKTGVVLLTTSLSYSTTTGYDLKIVVNDARNTAKAKVLTVLIRDINDPVEINNLPLPAPMPIKENTARFTSIFNVTSADQDTSQTHTYSMTSSGSGLTYFTINPSTGEIKTGMTVLNYETLLAASETSFTLNISVTDGMATDWKTLDIDVTDINETPTFSQTSYSLQFSSNMSSAGTVIGLPTYAVVDPDTGDSKMYSMNCGNGYFYMNSSNGQVEIQADYDVDLKDKYQNVTCSVSVYDSQGLNDQAVLLIHVDNQNDYVPKFIPTQYAFPVSYYAAVGTSVGQVTAYDDDKGVYGSRYYALNQTHLGDKYFDISDKGRITVASSLAPLGPGVIVNITGIVYDGGSLSDTAPITIFISELVLATTTPEGPRYRTFSEDSRNMPWLVGCLIVLMAIIGMGVWAACTCNGENSIAATLKTCRRRHLRPKLWRQLPGTKSEPSTSKCLTPVELSLLPSSLLMNMTIRHHPPPKRSQRWRSGDEGAPAGANDVTRSSNSKVKRHGIRDDKQNDTANDKRDDIQVDARDDARNDAHYDMRNDMPFSDVQERGEYDDEYSHSQTTSM